MGTKHKGAWSHGLPTKTCDVCHGTGMARGAADRVMASRSTFVGSVECRHCNGRGRVIDDPGSRICKHRLQFRDCALCRGYE